MILATVSVSDRVTTDNGAVSRCGARAPPSPHPAGVTWVGRGRLVLHTPPVCWESQLGSVCCMLGPGGVMTANCVTAGRLDHDDDGEAEVDSHPDSSHPRLRGGHHHRPGAMTAAGWILCLLSVSHNLTIMHYLDTVSACQQTPGRLVGSAQSVDTRHSWAQLCSPAHFVIRHSQIWNMKPEPITTQPPPPPPHRRTPISGNYCPWENQHMVPFYSDFPLTSSTNE